MLLLMTGTADAQSITSTPDGYMNPRNPTEKIIVPKGAFNMGLYQFQRIEIELGIWTAGAFGSMTPPVKQTITTAPGGNTWAGNVWGLNPGIQTPNTYAVRATLYGIDRNTGMTVKIAGPVIGSVP
jgi:hypothetical protein